MSRRIPLLAVVTVVALLAGGGVALAAWASSGPGSATARAGALGAPTASATAWVCTGLLGTSTSKFTGGGSGVEALPALPRATTTSTAAPPASTTTTSAPAPTTSSASPVTTTTTPAAPAAPASSAPAATTTTTTTAPPTSTTTGGASGIGSLASTLSWTAVPSATSYQFQAATTADFAAPATSGTTSTTSNAVTVRALVRTTVYLRVRAAAGAWTGAWSPTLTTSAGPCLL